MLSAMFATPVYAANECSIHWDQNCDITAADVRIAPHIAAKLQSATEYDLFVGDLDGDGKITAAEARKIL